MRYIFLVSSLVLAVAPALAQKTDSARAANASPVAAGTNHSLFIQSGAIYAAGQNSMGQMGVTGPPQSSTPVIVGDGNNYISVSSKAYTAVALRADGSIWGWGYNNEGQAGIGTKVRQKTPARIGSDTDWVSVSAGEMHVMGVKRTGTLWAWGKNTAQQFGIGVRPEFSMVPLQVGPERNWRSVSVGFGYTLAIKKDGTLWSWGVNASGMLGTGSTDAELTPVQVGKDQDWRRVEAGQLHTMAIKKDGTLWSWGANSNGQLGNGNSDSKEQRSPAKVGSDKWKAVSCGAQHSLGIKEDGTLWTWGAITGGLGKDMVRKQIPTQVGSANNWVAVSAGHLHSLATQSDGSVWAWGNNTDGALGVGNNTYQFVPVKVK